MESKEVDIKARVFPRVKQQLEAIADARGEKVSVILREAVNEYLTRAKIIELQEPQAVDPSKARRKRA